VTAFTVRSSRSLVRALCVPRKRTRQARRSARRPPLRAARSIGFGFGGSAQCRAPARGASTLDDVGDRYVFADEAGNFDFSRRPGASRYFILCTVSADRCHVGDELLRLRRELGWKGLHLDSVSHATEDPQAIRDEVFALLSSLDFRVDATILEKCKARPHLRDGRQLYKMAWFLHFKHVAPRIARDTDRLFVAASSLGTRKGRHAFHAAVDDVVRQVSPCGSHRVAFWPTNSDPCLQVADYCTWAIQRKWERGDDRSHGLIASKIHTEFDVWRVGSVSYY
jgi:hypothetical protein